MNKMLLITEHLLMTGISTTRIRIKSQAQCVENVQLWCVCWSDYGKTWTRKTSVSRHFSGSGSICNRNTILIAKFQICEFESTNDRL